MWDVPLFREESKSSSLDRSSSSLEAKPEPPAEAEKLPASQSADVSSVKRGHPPPLDDSYQGDCAEEEEEEDRDEGHETPKSSFGFKNSGLPCPS